MAVEMKEFEEELRIIAKVCLTDHRILEIVTSISKMTEDERNSLRSKVFAYFMSKNTQEDMEAYNFYKIILSGSNAKKVFELYENLCQTQGNQCNE